MDDLNECCYWMGSDLRGAGRTREGECVILTRLNFVLFFVVDNSL